MRKFLRSPFVSWSRRPDERRIGGVEISLLNSLFLLSSLKSINSEMVHKYYREAEDVLKILKPILNGIVHTQIASDKLLQNAFSELGHAIDELRELFETWQPWSSKIYFVLQAESLIAKVQSCSLKIIQLLISSYRCLPGGSSLRLLEHCVLEIKSMDYELLSTTISETIKDQVESSGASSDSLEKIADRLCLKSNQDLLIEIVALEKLKENSEQDEMSEEVERIEQIIVLVTHMRECLVMMKQSENSTSVSIPADFCCPLSLELMRNPVTVASGQTYERACIRKWIDLGLRVCPNTRQTLADTNLIPNCTLKAQITNWCESNSVELPVPMKALSLSQPSFVVLHGECGPPMDNHIVSTSWDYNYGSPESPCSSSSSRKVSISSSAILREAASPSQSYLSSEEPFCGAAIYGLTLDVERTSVKSSEGGLENSEDRSINSVSYYSMQLSTNSVSSTVESFLRGHSRTAYATPDSIRSLGSPTKSSPSSYAFQRETYSQPHVCSSSDASLPRVSMEVDVEMVSLNGSEDWMAYSSYGSMNSINYSMWLSMNDVPSVDGGSHLSHNRTTSASSTLSNLKLSRATSGVASESYAAYTVATSRGEFGFPSPLNERPCPPSVWRRLFERFNPRIVSSTVPETTSGLSESEKEVRKLVVDLKITSIDLRRNAAAELRLQAKHSVENQIMIRLSGASNLLHKVQENAVTALLKMSNNDNNKYIIVNAGAVEPLIDVLETGSHVAKKNSAATLFNLSVIKENKIKIGRSGVIKALVNVLGNGTLRGKKNAAKALFNLSILHKNKARMVQAGAVKHLVKSMQPADRMVDKAVAVLSSLATIHDGRISIDQGGIPVLVNVVKIGSARSKEYAAAALSQICFNSSSLSNAMDNKLKVGRLGAIKPLVDLLKSGTSRGKKHAASALFSLSLIDENKPQILHAGAVKYLIEALDPALWMVDDAVAVLHNLATIHRGRTAIVQEGGIPVVVEVINSGSARSKENAAATLLLLCTNSSRHRNIILQGAIPPLEALLQSGNTRARQKAEALLSYLRQDASGLAFSFVWYKILPVIS